MGLSWEQMKIINDEYSRIRAEILRLDFDVSYWKAICELREKQIYKYQLLTGVMFVLSVILLFLYITN